MNKFMQEALKEAEKARLAGDIPVGCVIVKDGEIIARSYNEREAKKAPTAHAECIAIERAAKALHDWRLSDCDLYVNLEPCAMCAGAIINARMRRVYFGAYDGEYGAAGGKIDLFTEFSGVKTCVLGGIMEKECEKTMEDFFLALRQRKEIAEKTEDGYRITAYRDAEVKDGEEAVFSVSCNESSISLCFQKAFLGEIILPMPQSAYVTVKGEKQKAAEGELKIKGNFSNQERINIEFEKN
ncbi:MAG: nucleoside deaminase [Clostridia bacterium]|nr:nucleoside deaminase [Clostridia bacterium]